MGFEQLAALKAQLTKEAKLKKQQERPAEKPAPAAKQGQKPAQKPGNRPAGKPAAKTDRPARPARSGAQPRANEKTTPVDPVVRVIGKLQKRYPAAFPKNPAPKVPLKVGILADLIGQAADLQLSEAEIREAVSTWCRGSRYWACLTDGAARIDLAGEPAGTVTARDAAFARNQAKGGPGGRRKPHAKPNAAQAEASQAEASQAEASQAEASQAEASQAEASQAEASQQPATDGGEAVAREEAKPVESDSAQPGTDVSPD